MSECTCEFEKRELRAGPQAQFIEHLETCPKSSTYQREVCSDDKLRAVEKALFDLQNQVVLQVGFYLYTGDHAGCDECGEHNGCGLGQLYDQMPKNLREMFEAKMKKLSSEKK